MIPTNNRKGGVHMASINRYLDEHGRLNVGELHKAAQEETAQKETEQAAAFRQYLNEATAPDKQLQVLLAKAGEQSAQEKEAEAQRRIEEEQAQANKEIEKRIRKETGAHKESDLDKAYKALLKGE